MSEYGRSAEVRHRIGSPAGLAPLTQDSAVRIAVGIKCDDERPVGYRGQKFHAGRLLLKERSAARARAAASARSWRATANERSVTGS